MSRTPNQSRWASVRGSVRLALAVAMISGVLTRGAPASPDGARGQALVDPVLLEQVALGPAPAILSWDEHGATREQVAAYLESAGVDAHVFDAVSSAVSCSADAGDVRRMSLAPGAISVWGDRPLIPALDHSVPTAFNGDPRDVWSPPPSGLGITGKGVGIAVLDTGLDGRHPDIAYGTRIKSNVRVLLSHRELMGEGDPPPCQDFYTDSMEDTEVASGHGTHLASVAAGDGTASQGDMTGMAPEADLIGINVIDVLSPEPALPTGQKLSLVGGLAGVNYILRFFVDGPGTVVNVALLGWIGEGLHDPWNPMSLAIKDLYDFGISVVMPAGNKGPAISNCTAADTCRFSSLAASPYVISVGATPKMSRSALETYSSRGDPTPYFFHDESFRYEPTLVAPGTGVEAARRLGVSPYMALPGSRLASAGGEDATQLHGDPVRYAVMRGTSVAAAHVAGAIALMQQAAFQAQGFFMSPAQVQIILATTATPMSGYARWQVGSGALDATAAVLAALQS